ncbi:MAG TPA: urease accessory UreF family protein [Polyangiaceae bacterium]|nr:urease accessory UreF family protein [Polyangiaceae bacterium]
MEDAALLRLLSLTSPALPVGAFAYSEGLEQAAELGFVSDEETAVDWIGGVLLGVLAKLDLPMVLKFRGAFAAGNLDEVAEGCRFLHACRETRELEEQDRHLGQSLARVLVGHAVPDAAPFVRDPDACFAALHALATVRFHIPERTALLGYCYSWTEAQTGALSRILPLGQLAIQRILFRILARVPAAIDAAHLVPAEDIGAFAPTHTLASMLHETQYTRLFRS